MAKVKIWYYATIKTEGNGVDEFNRFPDEIEHEGRKRTIRLTKDYFEKITKDADYGN